MIHDAKKIWAGGNEHDGRSILLEALDLIKNLFTYHPDEPLTLGNQGYISYLLGDKDKAYSLLKRAISLGGEEIRQAELKDADIYPLPIDEEFRELVKSI